MFCVDRSTVRGSTQNPVNNSKSQCGPESKSARKLGHASFLPVKSHWKINISANSSRITKSFGWLRDNFSKSSLNLPCLIAAEQYAYRSGGKIKVWSHLDEERPENPQNFHINPFRGHIESIKSARKRSPKVTSRNMPKAFSWDTCFMSNLYSKYANLRVNSWKTSPQLLLFLTFAICNT